MSVSNDPPSRWATGTAPGNAYNPMPGDLVSVDCKGIAPKYDQHGTRLGTVTKVSGAHGQDTVFVQLPGWAHTLCVDPEALTLVRRG